MSVLGQRDWLAERRLESLSEAEGSPGGDSRYGQVSSASQPYEKPGERMIGPGDKTSSQTKQSQERLKYLIKNDFLICSALKAPPAPTAISLVLFLEHRNTDVRDPFGLFKNGRRQSVSFSFVIFLRMGVKKKLVKKKFQI